MLRESSVVSAATGVTAVVQVGTLVPELPHAKDLAPKNSIKVNFTSFWFFFFFFYRNIVDLHCVSVFIYLK